MTDDIGPRILLSVAIIILPIDAASVAYGAWAILCEPIGLIMSIIIGLASIAFIVAALIGLKELWSR